jgi:CheY-like chemotaxis protein
VSEPTILIVDDDPETNADDIAARVAGLGATADAVQPEALSQADLEAADLILVDYTLTEWVDVRDEAELGRPAASQLVADRPRDGLALAAIVRSRLPADGGKVRGVALISADLDDLVKDFSPVATEQAAARVNSLEWAFHKVSIPGVPDLHERILELASAVATISDSWPGDDDEVDREDALRELLALGDLPWSKVAARDVHAAQPPIHQYAMTTHGLSILRWLGQRVLPYPTFLIDRARLAMACGVQPAAFETLDDDSLESLFGELRYRGPLATFLGPRWWGAGVRDFVREATGDALPGPEIAEMVAERLGQPLAPLEPAGAVLGIDGELQATGPVARERALRVRPDDWPPFAETGWMDEELLASRPDLVDMVEPADRARLER